MSRPSLYSLLSLPLTLGLLVGCGESKEMDDVRQAQRCLDHASPATAESCLAYIAAYDSPKSNTIRCSVFFLKGGLTNNKLVEAYKQLKDQPDKKEAVFIGVLALNQKSDATNADTYCRKSGVPGLIYLSNLSVIGTFLASAVGGFDPKNPASLDAAIAACQPPSADPNCEPATIGSAVISLSDSYCSGGAKDDDVCQKINGTIASAGGNTENVGMALFCYLDKKVYDPQSGTCQ